MLTDSQTDSELVHAIILSDTSAFKTLYFRYYDALIRFIFIRSGSSEFAEDGVQEIFTRLWNSRRNLDESQSIKAYLYRIANNLLIDHYRKRSSEKTYLFETDPPDGDDEEKLQEKIDIQSAIQALPETVRDVFILNRYQGLSYSEIAETFGISVKTVEKRMSQALDRLRKALSE